MKSESPVFDGTMESARLVADYALRASGCEARTDIVLFPGREMWVWVGPRCRDGSDPRLRKVTIAKGGRYE